LQGERSCAREIEKERKKDAKPAKITFSFFADAGEEFSFESPFCIGKYETRPGERPFLSVFVLCPILPFVF
jgi:hypothetical protein